MSLFQNSEAASPSSSSEGASETAVREKGRGWFASLPVKKGTHFEFFVYQVWWIFCLFSAPVSFVQAFRPLKLTLALCFAVR